MMRSESTSAFGHPSETKPTFGGFTFMRRVRAGAGVAERVLRGLLSVAEFGMRGLYPRANRQAISVCVLGRSAAENVSCDPEGVGVGLDGVRDWIRITTADGDRNRDSATTAKLEDRPVALHQALEGEVEAAQLVAPERIDPRQVEHQVRTEGAHRIQRVCERANIAAVICAVRQANVEIRWHFTKGEVFLPVHTENESAGVSGEQGSVPISLVH